MNRVPPTRKLSIGTCFFKKVFPVFLIIAAAFVVVALSLDGSASFGQAAPIFVMMAIMFGINRLLNSHLADEVLDGGDYLRVRVVDEKDDVMLRDIERVNSGSPQSVFWSFLTSFLL